MPFNANEPESTFIDVARIDSDRIFGLMSWSIAPRPVAWVATKDAEGNRNLAPFSFFTIASTDPPILMIAIEPNDDGSAKDTLVNILDTSAFVIHIVGSCKVREVAMTSETSDRYFDEIADLNLVASDGRLVDAPVISDSIAAYECLLHSTQRPGRETLVFGTVHGIHLATDVVDQAGRIVPSQLDPLARIGTTFARTSFLNDGQAM